jgi:hypothetical protein
MAAEKKYNAFISYSHQADKPIVRALHNNILRIGRAWYQRPKLPKLAIFRDETALSATASLPSKLKESVRASEYFILIACPEAANSQWVVANELGWWLEENARAGAKLLIVLTAGEICWHDETVDFDWSRTNALPHSLAGIFREEPKYVDLRPFRQSAKLSPSDQDFLQAVVEVAAPLYGVTNEALRAEESRRQRRTNAWLSAGILLFAAVAIVAAISFYRARIAQRAAEVAEAQATRERDKARAAEATAMSAQRRTEAALRETDAQRIAAQAEQRRAEAATS